MDHNPQPQLPPPPPPPPAAAAARPPAPPVPAAARPPPPPAALYLLRVFLEQRNDQPPLPPPPRRFLGFISLGHNGQPPMPLPPQLHFIDIYKYAVPSACYRSIKARSSFPISISISHSIALHFTVTNNSITISTPVDVNNEPPQLRVHDLSDMIDEQNSHPRRLHGLTLPSLSTLPACINITTNGGTFRLLVTGATIHILTDPSPSLTHQDGNGNREAIDRPIVLPFTLTLLFSNVYNSTIIAITINITSYDIYVMGYSQPGNIGWAAILDSDPVV
ncbi:unnamed protein product [Lupinus luteus]|uniref:Uncharacterized protein n=1 Tax=Lupinus luteus TaxID=3873 RepID=A0AAV1XGH5_LUPLU